MVAPSETPNEERREDADRRVEQRPVDEHAIDHRERSERDPALDGGRAPTGQRTAKYMPL
jgi:hypothetical protein